MITRHQDWPCARHNAEHFYFSKPVSLITVRTERGTFLQEPMGNAFLRSRTSTVFCRPSQSVCIKHPIAAFFGLYLNHFLHDFHVAWCFNRGCDEPQHEGHKAHRTGTEADYALIRVKTEQKSTLWSTCPWVRLNVTKSLLQLVQERGYDIFLWGSRDGRLL